ncbi:MAG: histidine kinase [Anaerolineae bacterium]
MRRSVVRLLRSLQFQLFLWAVLPITLLIIALAFTGVYAHQRAMRDFVADRDLSLARLVARSIEDGLAHGVISPDGEGLSAHIPPVFEDQPRTASLIVVSDTREILTRSAGQEEPDLTAGEGIIQALQQRDGFVIVNTELRGPVLVAFAPVMGTDWQVLIQEPVDEIVGPILRLSSLAPAAAVGAAVVSILILTFGWRTIIRPLRALADAAEQVSWGDLSSMATGGAEGRLAMGVQEIQDLHRALADMAERIRGYQAGVRDYLTALTEGQEAERARLARELHDGPVQDLIALGHRAESAQHLIERDQTEQARSLMADLRRAERETVEELRRIIGALRPPYLEDLGFVPAVEMLVRQAADRTQARLHLEKEADYQRLAPAVELAAYRIAQEALNNAVEHAHAETITVHVRSTAGGIVLSVVDDGVGFDLPPRPDVLTQAGHFGLMGMRERATLLRGSFHVRTAPSEGTRITVRLPAQPGEATPSPAT